MTANTRVSSSPKRFCQNSFERAGSTVARSPKAKPMEGVPIILDIHLANATWLSLSHQMAQTLVSILRILALGGTHTAPLLEPTVCCAWLDSLIAVRHLHTARDLGCTPRSQHQNMAFELETARAGNSTHVMVTNTSRKALAHRQGARHMGKRRIVQYSLFRPPQFPQRAWQTNPMQRLSYLPTITQNKEIMVTPKCD